jgi:hypothetical protein
MLYQINLYIVKKNIRKILAICLSRKSYLNVINFKDLLLLLLLLWQPHTLFRRFFLGTGWCDHPFLSDSSNIISMNQQQQHASLFCCLQKLRLCSNNFPFSFKDFLLLRPTTFPTRLFLARLFSLFLSFFPLTNNNNKKTFVN